MRVNVQFPFFFQPITLELLVTRFLGYLSPVAKVDIQSLFRSGRDKMLPMALRQKNRLKRYTHASQLESKCPKKKMVENWGLIHFYCLTGKMNVKTQRH